MKMIKICTKISFFIFCCFFSFNIFSQTVNWISPSSGDKGESLSVTISGSGIQYWDQYSTTLSEFRFTQFSSTTTFYGTSSSAGGNYLYGEVDIPCDVDDGYYNLEVYDHSTNAWIFEQDAFYVNYSSPQIVCLSSNSTQQGDYLSVEISGIDLNYGNQYSTNPTVKFSQFSSTNYFYTNVDSITNCNIYGNVFVPYTQPTGFYDVEVYNNYSIPPFNDQIGNALYIHPFSPPKVDSILPNIASLGQNLSVTISGTDINYGNHCDNNYSQFKLTKFNQFSGTNYEIFGTATGFYGSNLYGDISIPSNAPTGFYDVSVWDNNDSSWVTTNNLFYIGLISSSVDLVNCGSVPFYYAWYCGGYNSSTIDYFSNGTAFSQGYTLNWSLIGNNYHHDYLPSGSSTYYTGTFDPGLNIISGTMTSYTGLTGCFYLDVSGCSTTSFGFGCTDSSALNYDASATIDDSSCYYCDISNQITISNPTDSASCDGFGLVNSNSSFPITSYQWMNSSGTIISTNNYAFALCNDIYFLTVIDSNGCSITDSIAVGVNYGCTDSSFFEYDPLATVDDGSCLSLIVFGCTDVIAFNFNSTANVDDASCCYLSGCLDSTALNYNPHACFSDSTICIPIIFGCTDDNASNFNPLANTNDGSCVPFLYGCTDSTAFNYDSFANTNDGSCLYCDLTNSMFVIPNTTGNCDGLILSTPSSSYLPISYLWNNGTNTNNLVNLCPDLYVLTLTDSAGCQIVDSVLMNVTLGCTDSIAENFDPLASYDDGSCFYCISTISNTDTLNYYTSIYNSSGSTSFSVNFDDVSNVALDMFAGGDFNSTSEYFDMYINSLFFGTFQVGYQDCNLYSILYNYNISSYLNVGFNLIELSLSPSVDNLGCYFGAAQFDFSFRYSNTDTIYLAHGCTDQNADNYDPNAICDDGSCFTCDLNYTSVSYHNTPGNCDGSIYFVADSSNYGPVTYLWQLDGSVFDSTVSSFNVQTQFGLCEGTYTVTATDTNGCTFTETIYIGIVLGCTDSTAFNFNPLATVDDGSCIPVIFGCTDSTALNFFSGANTDDGSCIYCIYGCIDPLALNYDPSATCDDGSCSYANCTSPKPTGLYAYDVIDTRAKIGWDNMNDPSCMVWKYFVRYREVGTSQWTTKSAGVGNGLCNFGLNTVTKQLLNLTPSTTYEFRMKAFYCGGTSSNYSAPVQFTTADVCPDMTNLSATTFNGNQAKVRFDWDTTGAYTFARILLRIDVPGSNWQTAGGFGVYYPTLFVNKFGLTPGESYRAQGRTFCDSNITAYRSPTWTAPIFWTQPGSIREGGGLSINNLDIYPNPSRDIFNITFNSEEKQDLRIRILSVVGAEVYSEDRENFIGEYTKQVSLDNYGKGIYFLEIETNDGIVNKKLILQ